MNHHELEITTPIIKNAQTLPILKWVAKVSKGLKPGNSVSINPWDFNTLHNNLPLSFRADFKNGIPCNHIIIKKK